MPRMMCRPDQSRHPVDPDDEAAGGEAAQVVVALDQQDVGAEAGGGDGRGGSGRAAADDQHVGLGEDGDLAGRLEVGPAGRWRLLVPALAAEELDALLGADGVAQVARAGPGPSLKISDW